MKNLLELRDEIDVIDKQIVALYQQRMQIAAEVAEYKIETGKKVFDKDREMEKLATLSALGDSAFNRHGIRELFEQIMSISRKRQYQLLTEYGPKEEENFQMVEQLPRNNVTVVFQGVEGAYSYGAMRAYFQEDIKSYHVKLFRDAMEEVAAGRADYAVLPIENSTAGIVADIYDLLTEYNLFIVGEQILKVEHVLLGLQEAELSDIAGVYSHPQGLAQCKEYLEEHRGWKTTAVTNTAAAAQKVSADQDKTHAAIASRAAGEIYNLKVLAENICKNDSNVTRFIILAKKPVYENNSSRISVCFEAHHASGTLYNVLSHMIYNGLNMTKIESRPIPGKTWEYRFFVDFEGNLRDSAVKNALRGMEAETSYLKILGNY